MVVVGRQSGEHCLVQWAAPIDETTTRCLNINNWRRHGTLRAMYDRANYYLWRGWAHDGIVSGEDKRMVEALVPGPERLSKTDAGVIAWRKYAGTHARRAPEQAGGGGRGVSRLAPVVADTRLRETKAGGDDAKQLATPSGPGSRRGDRTGSECVRATS